MTESVKVSGKAASAAANATEEYPDILSKITEEGEYTHDQIFNVNERDLF